MTRVKFGTNLVPGTYGGYPDATVEMAQLAERCGWDLIGVADSQSILRELYSTLSLVAYNTESIAVGPLVTNGITRHPAVTTSAMCSIDEIADGRAFMGFGSGDSPMETIGKRPARLAEMKSYVTTCRKLMRGEEAVYDDHPNVLEWVRQSDGDRSVPVYMAADGPKTLELAGRIADVVLVGSGLTAETIDDAVERIDTGARKAGRDPDDVDKWVDVMLNYDDTPDEALDRIKGSLAGKANMSFKITTEGRNVPPEYEQPIGELCERYDAQHHTTTGETADAHNKRLVEDLGLADYLARRFGVVGTPRECKERFRRIADHDDVDGITIHNFVRDMDEVIRFVGEEVIPAVATGT